MKQHGIGVGYKFPHDFEGDDVEQQYLPDELVGRTLLRPERPGPRGRRSRLAWRLARRRGRRSRARRAAPSPPMAGMCDALRPREENRKKLAETQKKDASG